MQPYLVVRFEIHPVISGYSVWTTWWWEVVWKTVVYKPNNHILQDRARFSALTCLPLCVEPSGPASDLKGLADWNDVHGLFSRLLWVDSQLLHGVENDPPYVEVEAHADSIGGHQHLARVRGVIETSCHRQLGSRRQAAIDDCTFLSSINQFSIQHSNLEEFP